MDRYIKLVTDEALERPVIKAWFNSVSSTAPSGVVNSVTVADDDDKRHVVRLIHQVTGERHAYLVPLTRDLLPSEVDMIVDKFATKVPDLDFDVETHETRLRAKDENTIPLDASKHLALCLAFAKQQHEDWMHERSNAGWRYGDSFDPLEKTHPLLRPWDQLPNRYKEPDLDWPQKLVSVLNDNGYVVVQRDEFDKLLSGIPA